MKVYIIGSAGVPARYGGFEVFAENISNQLSANYQVYIACSKLLYTTAERKQTDNRYCRFFIPLKANGIQSVIYDFYSLLLACINADFVIMLGSGSGFLISIFKVFFKKPIAVHIDGIEWKREKWGFLSSFYLKINACLCYSSADSLIIDNLALTHLIPLKYVHKIALINYGCDHLPKTDLATSKNVNPYALVIARAEPENNLEMIIKSFVDIKNLDLIIISNWKDTFYGRNLLKKYNSFSHIKLIGPIYNEAETLQQYRNNCKLYIHGHSAGGTNPSLVEAMSAGNPIIAHDNEFNRTTTANMAFYFKSSDDISKHLLNLADFKYSDSGMKLSQFALQNYNWKNVVENLILLIEKGNVNNQ